MYFDAHADIWTDITQQRLKGETQVFRRRHLDNLRQGQVEGSIFVLWVDPPYDKDPLARTKQVIACAQAEMEECPELCVVHNYQEMMKAKEKGLFYVFIGVEGMAALGKDVGMLDMYYDFGARHGMLTWNETNALGASAVSGSTEGLTIWGKEVVKSMQRRGMIVDTSHLNEAGFWDIMRLTEKPIMASHSNAKALCSVPRNLTDDQLRAIRDTNGVVGLNAFNLFIHKDREKQTVAELAKHAAHMIDVMGIDHVGCGFDFFEFLDDKESWSAMGMQQGEMPSTRGIENCTQIPNLFRCFQEMGMSEEDMEKIAYGNVQRLIKDTLG